MKRILANLTLALCLTVPVTETRAEALGLSEVLASVAKSHPNLEIAKLETEYADAGRMRSLGAFDPQLSFRASVDPLGYYRNGQFSAELVQATPYWGLSVVAGYRKGWGDFPEYKGEMRTLSGGEFGAKLVLPLIKNRSIDERRAGLQKARLARHAARCGVSQASLGLIEKATVTYWKWIEAGKAARIQRELLELARRRDDGLRVQAAEGSIPAILATDNQRLVLGRKRKWVGAQAKLQNAAIALSMFLRDEDLVPIVVDESRLPQKMPEFVLDLEEPDAELQRALTQRPEICTLRIERKSADVDIRLSRQQRAPALDLSAGVAQDVGSGPSELGATEFKAGLKLSMPLALRASRGKYRQAVAKREMIVSKTRLLRDKIATELATARTQMQAAREQLGIAREQLKVARQLADAELARLNDGASSLVVLDLREIAAAEAAREVVHARVALQIAVAQYMRASGSQARAVVMPG